MCETTIKKCQSSVFFYYKFLISSFFLETKILLLVVWVVKPKDTITKDKKKIKRKLCAVIVAKVFRKLLSFCATERNQ